MIASRWLLYGVSLQLMSAAMVRAQPTASPPSPTVRWEVTQRSRYAGLQNQFRPGLAGDDQALSLRTSVRGDVAWKRVTLVGEFQDARAYLTDAHSNVSTTLIDAADLLQANARMSLGTTGRSELTIGRFGMELGSGRVVAQEVYRDVTRAFTGVNLKTNLANGTLTAFAVLPVQTLPEDRPSLLSNEVARDREHWNQTFSGAFFARPLWRSRGEVYVFRLDEHDDPGRLETRDRRLWTMGAHLLRNPARGQVDVDVEGMWQTGSAHATAAASDTHRVGVSAGYVHAAVGYTHRSAPWAPRLDIEYDRGTGDHSGTDSQWNRFDALFGNRRVDLGPTSIYGALGRENIDTAGVRLGLAPSTRMDVFAVYRVMRLASTTDAFASTGVRDPSGASGRDGGRQLDARVRAWLVPQLLRLDSGVTWFQMGAFMKTAPNATGLGNTTFYYADFTWTLSKAVRPKG
jgi:hypothetical protein